MVSLRAGAASTRTDHRSGRAATSMLQEMVVDGRLQRTWKDGRAHVPAFADDHAALTIALLDLFDATTDPFWLQEANGLATRTIALFWDDEGGGLFYTGHDAETLVSRSKRMLGGAEPSANGLAALAFARLAVLSGREELGAYADRIVRQYMPLVDRAPRALGPEAIAAAWRTGRTQELAIIGERDDPRTLALLAEARRRHRPLLAVAVVPPTELDASIPCCRGWPARGWGCPDGLLTSTSCRIPVRTPEALARQLDADQPARRIGAGRDRAPALPAEPEAWTNIAVPIGPEDLRGQVVVLDFWTSCCVNCLHLLPELDAIESRFIDAPVQVIGVPRGSRREGREMVERAIERQLLVCRSRTAWAERRRAWPGGGADSRRIAGGDREGRPGHARAGRPPPPDEGRTDTLAVRPGATASRHHLPPAALRFPGTRRPPAAFERGRARR